MKIEAFNVPNRPNFAIPSGRIAFTGVAADGSPVIAPTWGRITSTVTTSRQIQVGAKPEAGPSKLGPYHFDSGVGADLGRPA